jgi:hypothetical protein
MKNGSRQEILSLEAPLSPLSSRSERSAVEGPAVRRLFLGKCFSTEESLASGPTQGDENQLLFSNYSPWKHRTPLVIPTGAQRSGEICGLFLKMFFERAEAVIAKPRVAAPAWNWPCRTSVITLSNGVEIWTLHFGCSSNLVRRSQKRSFNSIG